MLTIINSQYTGNKLLSLSLRLVEFEFVSLECGGRGEVSYFFQPFLAGILFNSSAVHALKDMSSSVLISKV